MDSSGSEQGPMVGSCKCDNEPTDFVKSGEFDKSLRILYHAVRHITIAYKRLIGKSLDKRQFRIPRPNH